MASVEFLSPLTVRGRTARGSDLHEPKTVRQLLAFVRLKPDLAVVLVDADGDASGRRRLLDGVIKRGSVHAIAVQEFEALLIADVSAASRVLARKCDEAPEPDGMARGEAKQRWFDWSSHVPVDERAQVRRDVAAAASLETLGRRSESFQRLLDDLRPPR